MKNLRRPGYRTAGMTAGAGALILLLTASKCEQRTIFPPYQSESDCGDKVDNDGDGFADCKDTDCRNACKVTVDIDLLPGTIDSDTLLLKGTQSHATSVAVVSIVPMGTAGKAVISDGTWSAQLSGLTQSGDYTATVVATDGSLSDTARINFTRGK